MHAPQKSKYTGAWSCWNQISIRLNEIYKKKSISVPKKSSSHVTTTILKTAVSAETSGEDSRVGEIIHGEYFTGNLLGKNPFIAR